MTNLTRSLIRSNDQIIDEIVSPVTNRLMKKSEIKNVSINRSGNGDVLAIIETLAEPLYLLIWYRGNEETVEETLFRVHSDLQDDLAESSFAWGEKRG